MPRASGSKDYISLINGLITEASPLNFPENSTTDELNFVLNLDGLVRSRRLGLDDVSELFTLSSTNAVQFEDALYWQEPDVIVLVYTEAAPTAQTVLALHRGTAPFTRIGTHVLNSTTAANVELAANTNFVALTLNTGDRPYLLEYSDVDNNIVLYTIDLFVRDFELVDDGLQVTGRPASLTDEHRYNLYNAGWYAYRPLERTGELGDPLDEFSSASSERQLSASFVANNTIEGIQDISLAQLSAGDLITVADSTSNNGTYTVQSTEIYSSAPQLVRIVVQGTGITTEASGQITLTVPSAFPSNADIAALGMKANSDGDEVFSVETLNETVTGNTEAPRGHYVFNINNFDRNDRITNRFTDGTVDSTLTSVSTFTL